MQLKNTILKSVVVITLLLNISSLVSTQEGFDLLEEGIEDIDEFKRIANITGSNEGDSSENETSTANPTTLIQSSITDFSEKTDPTTEENTVTNNSSEASPASSENSVIPSSTDKSPNTTEAPVSSSTTIQNVTVTEESSSSSTDAMITDSSTHISSKGTSALPSSGSSSSTTTIITTTVQAGSSDAEAAKVKPWAIAVITVLISFAIIFTVLYFLRGYLIKKRRMDQRRLLLGSRVSQEGFFFGESGDGFREL